MNAETAGDWPAGGSAIGAVGRSAANAIWYDTLVRCEKRSPAVTP